MVQGVHSLGESSHIQQRRHKTIDQGQGRQANTTLVIFRLMHSVEMFLYYNKLTQHLSKKFILAMATAQLVAASFFSYFRLPY